LRSRFSSIWRGHGSAKEIAAALKPGGKVYVQTPFAFEIHGYPQDFFRFTREALHLLFEDAGLHEIETSYRHRAYVWSPELPDAKHGAAFLNSNVMAAKLG
jgi:hypothetical protein